MFKAIVFTILQILSPVYKVPPDGRICKTTHCQRTAEMYQSFRRTDIHPCQNFFEHACINYEIINELKPYQRYLTPFTAREEKVNEIILDYIKIPRIKLPGFEKVLTFYELCINEDQRRKVGYDTLETELTKIGMSLVPPFHLQIESKKDFAPVLGKIHRFSVRASKFLHRVSVHPSHDTPAMNIIEIGSTYEDPAACHHEESNQYTDEPMDKDSDLSVFRQFRRKYMISVINHLYEYSKFSLNEDTKKKITERVDDVLDLEVYFDTTPLNLKKNKYPQPKVEYKNAIQVKQLIDKTLEGSKIQIDFIKYLEELFTGSEGLGLGTIESLIQSYDFPVMISASEEFTEIYNILKDEVTPSAFESYIWWSVVDSVIEDGPAELYKYYNEHIAEVSKMGILSPPPRKEKCLSELKTYFGKFVGHVLARKTNGRKKKRQIIEMFENIKKSYEESIQSTKWVDEESKKKTLERIKSMTAFVGFDDSLLNPRTIDQEYKEINIEAGNYFKILDTLYKKKRENELFRYFTENKLETKPELNPVELIGSHYLKPYNQLVVPITDIEFPFYDLGLEVLHYATLGSTVAHIMEHAIDRTDTNGKKLDFLNDNSVRVYGEISNCFINAYNNFQFAIDERQSFDVNGKISVYENMADWQGYNMALMAYKKYEENHGIEPKLTRFSDLCAGRLFSLAYANMYCLKARDEYLIKSSLITSHASENTRVNGVLSLSKQFSNAWECKDEDPMNQPNKCEIWF